MKLSKGRALYVSMLAVISMLGLWSYGQTQITTGPAPGVSTAVTSLIPGTGATSLGKAIDSAVGSTDTGIAMLGKHQGDTVHLSSAENDYDVVRLSEFGAMQVAPEQHHVFDALDAVGSWLILDDATENFTTTKKHVLGTDALIFDKTDGSGTFAAVIDQTITTVDLGTPSPHDIIQTVVYIPTLTAVDYVLVRIGTNDTNYNEWRIPDTDLTAATFETLVFNIGDATHAGITGNGWTAAAITYIALGVQFDNENDALVGIIFDELSFHTNQHTSASLNAEVSTSVSSSNINVQKVGGSATDKNSGNKSNGSQRVVLATDDINTAAIKVAVELIDNVVHNEDVLAADAASGVPSLLVRDDVLAANAGVDGDGDYLPGRTDSFGSTWSALTADDGARIAANSVNGLKVDLGTDNDVVLAAGFRHANSPTTLVDTFSLFDGSAETQIATTNLGASKAYALSGTGNIVKVCIIVSLGTPFAENMSILFFDTDPVITIEDASLTLAQAQNVQTIVTLAGADFRDNFATAKVNCQDTNEAFDSVSHVVFASEGATTYDDEDIELRLWYRRDS